MENASKALLMAAGVLIAILIISIAVYLFSNFAGTSKQIHANIENNRIQQFNSHFTTYVDDDNVTIYDIITMANLATQNNQNHGFSKRTDVTGNDEYISVSIRY